MRKLEGKVVGQGIKIGIVAARFNEFIVYNVNQARLRYVLKIQFD